jgi:hypothetical protein
MTAFRRRKDQPARKPRPDVRIEEAEHDEAGPAPDRPGAFGRAVVLPARPPSFSSNAISDGGAVGSGSIEGPPPRRRV